jgi:hypothetical protein
MPGNLGASDAARLADVAIKSTSSNSINQILSRNADIRARLRATQNQTQTSSSLIGSDVSNRQEAGRGLGSENGVEKSFVTDRSDDSGFSIDESLEPAVLVS